MMKQKMFSFLVSVTLGIAFSILVFCVQIAAQEKAKANPLKKAELIKVLESNSISSEDLIERINTRGVDFQINERVEQDLKEAGANDQIIYAVRENYNQPKKKGIFGKIGGGLNKTAKIAVKTAPIVAEQLPQVQTAKAVVKAAKTASNEVEKQPETPKDAAAEAAKETTKETPKKSSVPRSLIGTAWKIDFGKGVTGTIFLFCKGGKRWEIVPARAGTIGAVGKSYSVSGSTLTTVNADDAMVQKWKMTWEGDVLVLNDGKVILKLHYSGETQCK